jgi:hypothetical protein
VDPETAQRAFTSRRKADAVLARLRSAGPASLPRHEGLRGLLEATYGHEPEHTRRDAIEQKLVDISQLVAGLSDADRSALIRTLLPGVAGSAEAAWHLLARRPYQHVHLRPLRKHTGARPCRGRQSHHALERVPP